MNDVRRTKQKLKIDLRMDGRMDIHSYATKQPMVNRARLWQDSHGLLLLLRVNHEEPRSKIDSSFSKLPKVTAGNEEYLWTLR